MDFLFAIAILTVPNAINDLIPSYSLDVNGNGSSPTSPLFTHLDLYLLVGVFWAVKVKNFLYRVIFPKDLVLIFVYCTSISFFINNILSSHEVWYQLLNLTQLRYLVLISLVYPIFAALICVILIMACFGVCLLATEAILFTRIGNFAYLVETWYNSLAVLCIGIWFFYKHQSNSYPHTVLL